MIELRWRAAYRLHARDTSRRVTPPNTSSARRSNAAAKRRNAMSNIVPINSPKARLLNS